MPGTMKYLLFLVIAVTLTCCLEFNCNRNGQVCDNGSCLSDGSCNCTDTEFDGYKCQQNTSAVGGACSTNCSQGLCSQDSSTCVCTEDEYGADCEFKRFQHKCDVNGKMFINANVENPFIVYVDNETNCPLTDVAANIPDLPTDWEGYAREIDVPSDSNCGTAGVTTANNVSTVCVTAYIRYIETYWTNLDTRVTYCCAGTEVTDVVVESIDVDFIVPGTTVQPSGNPSYVIGQFNDDTGVEITDSATIGDTVVLNIKLSDDAPFVDLQPLECDLVDDPNNVQGNVALVFDECEQDVLDAELVQNVDGSYNLKFEMVKFVTSPKVYMVCDVRLCAVEENCAHNETKCQILGRKKRSAPTDSETEDVQPYVFSLDVKDPFLQGEETVEVQTENQEKNAEATIINMTAAVIGLAVVVFILLIACLIMAVCLITRQRSPKM